MLIGYFSVYQVDQRHTFLERLIGVKMEEKVSFENIHLCANTITACVSVFSVMEIISYFLYLNKVCLLEIRITNQK